MSLPVRVLKIRQDLTDLPPQIWCFLEHSVCTSQCPLKSYSKPIRNTRCSTEPYLRQTPHIWDCEPPGLDPALNQQDMAVYSYVPVICHLQKHLLKMYTPLLSTKGAYNWFSKGLSTMEMGARRGGEQ